MDGWFRAHVPAPAHFYSAFALSSDAVSDGHGPGCLTSFFKFFIFIVHLMFQLQPTSTVLSLSSLMLPVMVMVQVVRIGFNRAFYAAIEILELYFSRAVLCLDTDKLNMEFLRHCFFPRVFSMVDAVYCARFVQTLHSIGTLSFNTVNHIDCLIWKILQPVICCCTEYEAGRLGQFLYKRLKMVYHWKVRIYSHESIFS